MLQLDFGFLKPDRQLLVVRLPKRRQTIIPVIQQEFSFSFSVDVTVSVGVSCPSDSEETIEEIEWSDEQIATLHESLLYRSIELLRDTSTNPLDREDILQWVFAPNLVRFEKDADGYLHQVRGVDVPFTFARCCALIGADADSIREALPRLLLECGIEVQFL